MKSFLLVIGLIFAQSAFCQSTTIKAGLKNATIISDTIQTPRPLKNLNLPVIYTFTGNGVGPTLTIGMLMEFHLMMVLYPQVVKFISIARQ